MKFSNVWTEIAVTAVLTAIALVVVAMLTRHDYSDLLISYAIFMAATIAVRLRASRRQRRDTTGSVK